jgi:hypothetical protein
MVIVYFGGIIIERIGKKIGGKATLNEVTAAIAWMNVPGIIFGILTLLYLSVFKEELFPIYIQLDTIPPLNTILLVLVSIFLFTWWQYIRIVCISEVHQFSIWKSMVALYVPIIILVALYAAFIFLFLAPLSSI